MKFRDNLEIPGGNTRWQIKVEVGLGYCFAEDKCLKLHEKWYLKENMVRTTIAKGQIPDIRWTYTKGIINFREALMVRSTSCPWAWTQGSRSTPTSPMHTLSFTSRFRCSYNVEILSGKIPEEYDTWKLSSSHILRKACVQPIRVSWKHIPQASIVNTTSSKAEHGWSIRG